jgi:uncharacterized protein DUF4384
VRVIACGCLLAAWALGASALEGASPSGAKEAFYSSRRTIVVSPPEATAVAVKQQGASAHPGATTPSRGTPVSVTTPARQLPANHPPPAVALALRFWVELLRGDPRSPGMPMAPDSRFHSGDRVRLHFESSVSGYLSLFQLGTNGAASRLYPDPEKGDLAYQLPSDESRAIPAGTAWFRFDDQPGVEHLLVAFAARPEQLRALKLASRIAPAEAKQLIAGGKNLLLETEREDLSEVGTFVASLAGEAIIVPIDLIHD